MGAGLAAVPQWVANDELRAAFVVSLRIGLRLAIAIAGRQIRPRGNDSVNSGTESSLDALD